MKSHLFKKSITILSFIFFISHSIFSLEKIATTYQTNLKPTDMVDIFLEQVNKSSYAYQIWDYEVYTNENEQNYAWGVGIDDSGYTSSSGDKVMGRSVYLFMKNGYICFETFGGPTQVDRKKCYNGMKEWKNIYDSCKYAITNYIAESQKWLTRYDKTYRDDEILALDKLTGIMTILGIDYFTGEDTAWFDNYDYVELSDELINALEWREAPDFSLTYLMDKMKRKGKAIKGLPFHLDDYFFGDFSLKEGDDKLSVRSLMHSKDEQIITEKKHVMFHRLVNDKIYTASCDEITFYDRETLIDTRGKLESSKSHHGYYDSQRGIFY